MERLPTQCKAVDLLVGGGLAAGTITQIFGEKALGKSLLSLQAAFATVAGGHGAIILDTEQSYHSYLIEPWREKLNRRFGKEIPIVEVSISRRSADKEEQKEKPKSERKKFVPRSQVVTAISSALNRLEVPYTQSQLDSATDVFSSDLYVEPFEVKEPSVVVVQVPEVADLLGMHGVEGEKALSEGGRVELHLLRTPSYHSILRQMVKDTEAKLVVYDSISAPFKASFPSTQDLPARSASLSMMLTHAQRLCVEYAIAVVAVAHVSGQPDQPVGQEAVRRRHTGLRGEVQRRADKRCGEEGGHRRGGEPRGRVQGRQGGLAGKASRSGRVFTLWFSQDRRRGDTLMGWKIKVPAFFFGLFSLSLGAILIGVPVLLWVLWPWIRGLRNSQKTGTGSGFVGVGGSWMEYLGLFFVFLAAVALLGGGSLSPILFGGIGVALVFYGRGSAGKVLGGLVPVRDSILMRTRFVPFNWLALVEVKVTTKDVAKVLPNVNERLLVTVDGKASAYAVIQASGLREADAEEKVVSRMQELSKVLAPSGAYLLPIDASVAASLIRRRGRPVKLDTGNLEQSLVSTPYDVVSICTHGHVAVALGAYRSADDGQEQLSLPYQAGAQETGAGVGGCRRAGKAGDMAGPGRPDGVPRQPSGAGGRASGTGSWRTARPRGSSLLVRSVRSNEIELSRAQLRALVRAYS